MERTTKSKKSFKVFSETRKLKLVSVNSATVEQDGEGICPLCRQSLSSKMMFFVPQMLFSFLTSHLLTVVALDACVSKGLFYFFFHFGFVRQGFFV